MFITAKHKMHYSSKYVRTILQNDHDQENLVQSLHFLEYNFMVSNKVH